MFILIKEIDLLIPTWTIILTKLKKYLPELFISEIVNRSDLFVVKN